jgi:hypothetical protein
MQHRIRSNPVAKMEIGNLVSSCTTLEGGHYVEAHGIVPRGEQDGDSAPRNTQLAAGIPELQFAAQGGKHLPGMRCSVPLHLAGARTQNAEDIHIYERPGHRVSGIRSDQERVFDLESLA